jgi:hypothetical protein
MNRPLVERFLNRCPESGKIVGFKLDNPVSKIWIPLVGLAAIIWFLIRVIPKPSRATYPCQQVAAGLGVGFLSYLGVVLLSFPVFKAIRKKGSLSLAKAFILISVILITTTIGISISSLTSFRPNLSHSEPANTPFGKAIGIYPGRVTWDQDFSATIWDEKNGFWWDDANTNQQVVDKMFSASIKSLTGAKTDSEAWLNLFLFNNQKNGRGKHSYKKGEKIVIKINCNATTTSGAKWTDRGYSSPQVINALVKQLIEVAGVAGSDITITDPSRYISENIYNKVRSNPSDEFRKITFEQKQAADLPGYKTALPDKNNKIYFMMPGGEKMFMYLPQSFSEATYLINLSVVRPHRVFGITSAGKNLFGCVFDPDSAKFIPTRLHAFALWDYPTPNKMGDPHSNPVLLGHKTIISKTFLYLSDGLYTGYNQGSAVKRWSTMENKWFSSILMSQDPVALESVVFDFISSEPNLTNGNPSFNGNQENTLHESALANDPPSRTKYDPENDGNLLQSLGVHEHWNNNKEKKYSGNLRHGGGGIELITLN